MLRKTKIVCTLGPAVRHLETIKQLLLHGMNIARFNFSHGDHAYHLGTIEMVREASQQTGIPVALLLDTKGPEIRTGHVKNDQPVQLVSGKSIILTTDEVEGTEECISISYKNLPQEISPGKHILNSKGFSDNDFFSLERSPATFLMRQN